MAVVDPGRRVSSAPPGSAARERQPRAGRGRSSRRAPGLRPQGVYCVLGMHRSGTSLVASLLQEGGVAMGERQLGPHAWNPRGFFEDVDFFQLHEACLLARGETYADPSKTRFDFRAGEERARARALIQARADLEAWGWKDPRTCLFAGSWSRLLPECRYVVVYRHPLAVLESLLRRGDPFVTADPAAGLRTWATYTRAALDFLDRRKPQGVCVEADAVLQTPAGFCRLVRGLGVPLPVAAVRRTARAGELVRLPALDLLEPLLGVAAPDVLTLHRRFANALDLPARRPPRGSSTLRSSLRAISNAGLRVPRRETGVVHTDLLVAGLALASPPLRRRLAERRDEALHDAQTALRGEMHASESRLQRARSSAPRHRTRRRPRTRAHEVR